MTTIDYILIYAAIGILTGLAAVWHDKRVDPDGEPDIDDAITYGFFAVLWPLAWCYLAPYFTGRGLVWLVERVKR